MSPSNSTSACTPVNDSHPASQPATPNTRTNHSHLPHFPSFSPLHINLPRVSRPKLIRRHTEPANLKIECCSGPTRKTHSSLSTCTSRRRGTIKQHDVFVCSNAVNAPRLVALTREAMDTKVHCWGGNAMVDESWSYTILQRKSNHGCSFKVSITYTGVVAQCDRPDPHCPVAIEEAKSIPGLMTIVSRE